MKKGALLVDVMVASAIFFFVAAAVLMVFKVADSAWTLDGGFLQIQRQLRSSVSGMMRELRQAKKEAGRPLAVSADFQSVQFYIPGITDAVRYYLQNGQLLREHPVHTISVLANNINQLRFCCVGGAGCSDCAGVSQVQVYVLGQKIVRDRTVRYSLDEKVELRNE